MDTSVFEYFGMLGVLVLILAHLTYTVYENRRGIVKKIDNRVESMAVIQYRQAKELEDIDDDAVRHQLFNGDQIIFPGDFDDNDPYSPDGGWSEPSDEEEES